ncbi:hypothetical protein [Methylomonas methanica]|uniref:Uncharacterized protein n=1 Tax=Methylomonas methanica TaxID=421 RepID=A0A177MQU5_METMH|nr:hypothetical protein [Methylomonas methanica]OAI07280.1 hypothetical protein A1332_09120 [Methylomonas methanica]
MNSDIGWNDIKEQINHWLKAPENGYLGSGFGFGDKLASFLKEQPNDSVVNQIVSKMQEDIPVLKQRKVSINWVVGNNQVVIVVDKEIETFDFDTLSV